MKKVHFLTLFLVGLLQSHGSTAQEKYYSAVMFSSENATFTDITIPADFGEKQYDLWVYVGKHRELVDSGIDLIAGEKFVFPVERANFAIFGLTPADSDKLQREGFKPEISFGDGGENPLITVTPIIADPSSKL